MERSPILAVQVDPLGYPVLGPDALAIDDAPW